MKKLLFLLLLLSEMAIGQNRDFLSKNGVFIRMRFYDSAAVANAIASKLSSVDTGNIANFHQKVKSLFSGSAPLTYNSVTGVFGINQATGSTNGYLSSIDWNTFNGKLSSVDTGDIPSFHSKVRGLFSATAPITYSNGTFGINTMSATVGGAVPTPPNDATKFLNGQGAFTVPAGGGDMELASVQTVTGAKTFNDTKLLLRNVANTFNGRFTNTNTANRVYTLKDADGTIAFTSDITGTNSGTNTGDQTITLTGDVTGIGTGTFAATIGANKVVNSMINDVAWSKITGTPTTISGYGITNGALSGANTDITSVLLNQTGLVVKGASSNALTIKPNETLSTGRTFSIVTGDASRSLTFTADATIGGTHSGTSSGTNTGDQTITLTSDVTGTGTGSFATTIASGAVTLAKMANIATSSLIYRKTAGSGAPEVNTLATLKTDLGLTGTNSGDQTTVTGNAGTATALQNIRTIWGQNFDGTANVTGSLTAVGDITGGASNMTITSGTGNSRTLILRSTTSGGTATTFLTGNADQSATFANTVNATTFVGALTGNASTASSAATWTTARSLWGNSVNGSADITSIIASTYGGTGNGFTKFSGPATSEKTFTLPNASANVLTDNAAVTIAQGGTGQTTASTARIALLPSITGNALKILRVNAGETDFELAAAGGGSGTVTNTGNLTANSVVLGNAVTDTKVVAGITTDGTSQLNLGVNTTTLGKVKMFGNTSGDATIQPAAAAGTATVITLPATTSTLATLAANTFTATQTMAAGSTSAAPIALNTGGSLKTTSAAGDVESVSGIMYYSSAAAERGVVGSEQLISLTSGNTLTSQTAVQPIFDGGGGPTNGRLTVAASRSYYFECSLDITNMSSTSGTWSFSFGGTATLTSIRYQILSRKGSLTTAGTCEILSYNVATASVQGSAGTATNGTAYYTGIIRVNGAGTLIPQVSFSTVAGAVTPIISADSFLRMRCIGTNTVVNVGNWD
jgi:hypothetical protein